MLRLTTVAPALALITVLAAAPTAAFAATDAPTCAGTGSTYASSTPVTSDSPVVAPSQTVTVTWADGYFQPGAAVTVSISGPAASGARIVTPEASGTDASTVADAAGGLVARVTLASTATGSLSVQGWSATGCGGVTVGTATPASTSANSLAYTGGSVPTVLAITGAGALAFGGILVAARLRSRKRA